MLNWPRKNGQAFGMGREEEEKREVSLEGETECTKWRRRKYWHVLGDQRLPRVAGQSGLIMRDFTCQAEELGLHPRELGSHARISRRNYLTSWIP